MNRKLLILITLVFKVCIGTAQAPLTGTDSTIVAEGIVNGIKDKSAAPFGTSSLSNFFSNISVSSFLNEGVNGKIELQGKFNSRWSGGVTIDQKIGSASSVATPITLSGISPGTTVEFNLQKIFWRPSFNLTTKEIEILNNSQRAYAARKGIPDFRNVSLRDITQDGTEEEKELAHGAFNSVSFKQPVFINARVGFTKTSFYYTTDSFDLAESYDAFITPSFTFSVIKTLGGGFDVAGYVALSYRYGESYVSGDDITFSIPFGATPNYYTNTLAFGKPGKVISNNIIAEYRRNLFIQNKGGKFSNIAISPSVTVDFDNKKLGVFLPVYFIKGSDGEGNVLGLQGGIRFGYITSTESGKFSSFNKGFTAQLIISQPLDFLKNL